MLLGSPFHSDHIEMQIDILKAKMEKCHGTKLHEGHEVGRTSEPMAE